MVKSIVSYICLLSVVGEGFCAVPMAGTGTSSIQEIDTTAVAGSDRPLGASPGIITKEKMTSGAAASSRIGSFRGAVRDWGVESSNPEPCYDKLPFSLSDERAIELVRRIVAACPRFAADVAASREELTPETLYRYFPAPTGGAQEEPLD